MQQRFYEHNSGYLSRKPADPNYRPWALLVYYTGFANEQQRKGFERMWMWKRDDYKKNRLGQGISVMDVIACGDETCSYFNGDQTHQTRPALLPSAEFPARNEVVGRGIIKHQCFATIDNENEAEE